MSQRQLVFPRLYRDRYGSSPDSALYFGLNVTVIVYRVGGGGYDVDIHWRKDPGGSVTLSWVTEDLLWPINAKDLVWWLSEAADTAAPIPFGYLKNKRDNDPDVQRRLRDARFALARTNPELVPHGLSGYDNWGCRCGVCRKAKSKENAKSSKRRRGESVRRRWTVEELEVVARTYLTAEQVGEMLGRTVTAVRLKRSKMGVKEGSAARPAGRSKAWGRSRFKGVYQDKKTGRWRAELKAHGEKFRLGGFGTEVEAGMAYDRAAVERLGSAAVTNLSLGLYSEEELQGVQEVRGDASSPVEPAVKQRAKKRRARKENSAREEEARWKARVRRRDAWDLSDAEYEEVTRIEGEVREAFREIEARSAG